MNFQPVYANIGRGKYMLIVVGLGNIGEAYLGTYHNIGFMCVEALAEALNLKLKKLECRAITGVKEINSQKIVLAKPTTYMNLSGEAVKALLKKYNATENDLIVLVDDFDLPLGALRLKANGSAGTHNGLKNIVELLGTTEFKRIRVGIGNPRFEDIKDFVLSKIAKDEAPIVIESVKKVRDALLDYIENENFASLQQKYNRKDD